MTSHKPLLAEISNINIFHITQYFWVKSYKRNQWNLPNILAYISGIFDDFFKAGLVPLTVNGVLRGYGDLLKLSGSKAVFIAPRPLRDKPSSVAVWEGRGPFC